MSQLITPAQIRSRPSLLPPAEFDERYLAAPLSSGQHHAHHVGGRGEGPTPLSLLESKLWAHMDTHPAYVVTAAGPTVSQWNQRAGSEGLALAQATVRPDYVAGGLDGRYTIVSDATEYLEDTAITDPPAASEFSVYVVAKMTGAGYLFGLKRGTTNFMRLQDHGGSFKTQIRYNNGSAGWDNITGDSSDSNWHLHEISCLVSGNLIRSDSNTPVTNGVAGPLDTLGGSWVLTMNLGPHEIGEFVFVKGGRTAQQDADLRGEWFAPRWPTLGL